MATLPSGAAALNSRKRQAEGSKRTRKPSRRLIKIHRNYTVDEVARAIGRTKPTIWRLIKSGTLPAITDQKPSLVLGGDLLDYLEALAERGPRLQLHECFCFKCRVPRVPALGMAEYVPLTASTGILKALCTDCCTVMNKTIAKGALETLAHILDVTVRVAHEHLADTAKPFVNHHLDQEPGSHA